MRTIRHAIAPTGGQPDLLTWAAGTMAFLCAAMAGLGLSRLLYDALFPQARWLARVEPSAALALVMGLAGWHLWQSLESDRSALVALAPLLPLLLNVLAVANPGSTLLQSRLLFSGTLWLSLALLSALSARRRRYGLLLLVGALLTVYLLTMGRTVGRADTFEFQVVIPTLGIVHPTGYPLYLLLGKLFTFIPLGSMAWRINLSSAVYAITASALIFLLVRRLTRQQSPALLAALLLALGPTFWSQAIEAEVYMLHALIVASALYLMVMLLERSGIGDWRLEIGTSQAQTKITVGERETRQNASDVPACDQTEKLLITLALVLGLGLTNHLTTLILLPPALLTTIFALTNTRTQSPTPNLQSPISNLQSLISNLRSLLAKSLPAFLLPLLLYAYLPLRWQAVNGEPMGLARFVDWVVGGRFQGALHLSAVFNDPARYGIVGRLLLAEWQTSWLLFFALVGFLFLVYRHWRLALILSLTWLGYVYYALSYYVPDLAVFLIPAHLVLAILWGVGLTATIRSLTGPLPALRRRLLSDKDTKRGPPATPADRPRRDSQYSWRTALLSAAGTLLVAAVLLPAVARRWPSVDRSQSDGGTGWAAAVLQMPLAEGAAILADSDKFPPLYYLQQAEGLRPDLDILVLPDEAAYRTELSQRLAAGQPVYLARYLPGLEGQYHLRSVGPLVQVAREPLATVPSATKRSSLTIDGINLLGYELAARAPVDPSATSITLYWQAEAPLEAAKYVYVRWHDDEYEGSPIPAGGQHPANNYYPTVAWEPGEVVPDYHILPQPKAVAARSLDLQVALAPPFTAPQDLVWQTVTIVPATTPPLDARPLQAQVGSYLLREIDAPTHVRPQEELDVFVGACADEPGQMTLDLELVPAADSGDETANTPSESLPATDCERSFVHHTTPSTDLPPGRYRLWARVPGAAARCHWLASLTNGCDLGSVEISGVPLPPGATNFDDKVALLEVDVSDQQLQPGGRLRVDLRWQALSSMQENYTVFVQVVDAQDRIVGQVDSWPVQGTYPTSQWQPGQIVNDPYGVQLDSDLPPGQYRLLVGWYLLATQHRLPVLNEAGAAVEDKVIVPGLFVTS